MSQMGRTGTKLPDDKILIPGVLDTSTNYVEHPELVAQRICHKYGWDAPNQNLEKRPIDRKRVRVFQSRSFTCRERL